MTMQLILIMIILSICIIMLMIRFLLGPTVMDRLACLEAFSPAIVCLFAIWGVAIRTHWFFDVILVLSLVGFLSTVASVKYVEQGVIEND